MDTGSKKIDVTAELNEAVRSFNQGKFEDTKKICGRILVENPDDVTALNFLGGSLARTGKIAQAIQAAERVCFLSPGNALFYSNLSYLHSVTGDVQKAILVMAHAIMSDTKSTVYQTKFARMIDHLEFYKLTDETTVIKEAINVCMGNPDIDVESFSTAWHSLLLLDPAFIKFAALTQHDDFNKQAEKVNFKELAEPLTDPFLLLGLKSLHATNVRYERTMTFFRHFFISRFDDYDVETFLPFLCALAEHCNLNEYVYRCTKQEQMMADALEGKLDLSANVDVSAMSKIALISCYKDLMQLDCAGIIAEASADSQSDAFVLLIENTVSIPTKTREYRDTISAISSSNNSMQNVVSSYVAKQYEENPYPRWRHLGIPVQRVKRRLILLTAMGVGTSVAVAGTISFIGLVVPHIIRLLIGPDHRYLVPGSAIAGAILLASADAFARIIVAPAELPAGILTALLGAPVFFSLLIQTRGQREN